MFVVGVKDVDHEQQSVTDIQSVNDNEQFQSQFYNIVNALFVIEIVRSLFVFFIYFLLSLFRCSGFFSASKQSVNDIIMRSEWKIIIIIIWLSSFNWLILLLLFIGIDNSNNYNNFMHFLSNQTGRDLDFFAFGESNFVIFSLTFLEI